MISIKASAKRRRINTKEWLDRGSEKERDERKRLATKRRKTTTSRMERRREMKRRQSEGEVESSGLFCLHVQSRPAGVKGCSLLAVEWGCSAARRGMRWTVRSIAVGKEKERCVFLHWLCQLLSYYVRSQYLVQLATASCRFSGKREVIIGRTYICLHRLRPADTHKITIMKLMTRGAFTVGMCCRVGVCFVYPN